MAHKTFISYKYSEARGLRDRIINSLGEDATYYEGETSNCPDLTDTSTENIKKKLSDMMYDTSVTIVILSPNMKSSEWIEWEIEYSLKTIQRKNRTSHVNGIVGVIMKYDGGYDWFELNSKSPDGCFTVSYKKEKVFNIINNNRFNQKLTSYICEKCRTVDWLNGSYIAFVEEDTFLNNPKKFIDNAYEKSEDDAKGYNLCKKRKDT